MIKGNNMKTQENSNSYSVFVGRQPVFTTDMSIWGCELLFRDNSTARTADFEDPDRATSQVIIDGLTIAQTSISQRAKLMVNFTENSIMKDVPYVLPEGNVVELLEEIVPTPEIIQKCCELKKNYLLAVDDYTGSSLYKPFIDLADIVKVDVLHMDQQDIHNVLRTLKGFPGLLLAEKVEDYEMYELTRECGFVLFQGFFFSKPVTISGKTLGSNEISKLKLLAALEKTHFDPQGFSEIIRTDLAISYRLLNFVNSIGLGLLCQVRSITHAIKMLGEKKIRQWIRVFIMADISSKKESKELIQLAATRAFFLHELAQEYETPYEDDSMFLLGLLSLLNVALNQKMSEVIQYLPLEEDMRDTLLGEDTEARKWLDLAIAFEKTKWESVDSSITLLGVNTKDIGTAYHQGMKLSYQLLHSEV
jgi:EAL and modified HD-GYP domain-containing signal transduction protein